MLLHGDIIFNCKRYCIHRTHLEIELTKTKIIHICDAEMNE